MDRRAAHARTPLGLGPHYYCYYYYYYYYYYYCYYYYCYYNYKIKLCNTSLYWTASALGQISIALAFKAVMIMCEDGGIMESIRDVHHIYLLFSYYVLCAVKKARMCNMCIYVKYYCFTV